MMPSLPSSPSEIKKPDLWKKAYDALKQDPDQASVLSELRAIINKHGNHCVSHLTTDNGRNQLLSIIDQKSARIQTNPKSDPVRHALGNMRRIITVSTAASPPATVAVAGLFIAFDLTEMWISQSRAMLDLATFLADVICELAVESHQVVIKNAKTESKDLQDLRIRLQGSYIRLYRQVLYLSAKLVCVLSGFWRRTVGNAFGVLDWVGETQGLKDLKKTVTDKLEVISREIADPGKQSAPLWKSQKRTKLHTACKYGMKEEVYDLLYNKGGDAEEMLNAKSALNWTALMFAVQAEEFKIVEMLLDCKNIKLDERNSAGRTALHMAVLKNKLTLVKKLLASNAKVDVRDVHGRTAFTDAAKPGYLQVMKELRKKGASIDQVTDKNGWTALHSAVGGNQLETVKWLVEVGADKNIKIKSGKKAGMTARDMAAKDGKQEILAVL